MPKVKTSDDTRLLYRGLWWVPGFEEQKFYGELVRESERGIELKMTLPFVSRQAKSEPIKIVHGKDEHGNPVTLMHVFRESYVRTGALMDLTFGVGYCFHGIHHLRWAEAAFREVDLEFPNFTEWVDLSGFKNSERIKHSISVTHTLLPDRVFEIATGESLHLFAVQTLNSKGSERTVSEYWVLRLRFDMPIPFREIREKVRSARRFLSFGFGARVAEGPFVLRKTPRTKDSFSRDVRVYVPGLRWEETPKLSSYEMLFTFPDIQMHFKHIYRAWTALEKRLRDVMHLLFSARENKSLYTNHRFLLLAQALEVYHRCWPERYMQSIEPKDEFQKRVRRIKGKLDRSDAKWFSSKVSFANQATLNSRIREVLADKAKWLGELIPDPERFSESVRDLRNHFTHWPESKKMQARIEDLDDFDLSERLFRLLLVCVLSDLEFPHAVIEKAARYHKGRCVPYTEVDEADHESSALVPLARINPRPSQHIS